MTTWTRRRVIGEVGTAFAVGSLLQASHSADGSEPPCPSSQRTGGGAHWRNGAAVDCLFGPSRRFDALYDHVRPLANQFVSLTHSHWDHPVRVRFGDVERASDERIRRLWRSRYGRRDDGVDPFEDGMLMLCGTWGMNERHLWSHEACTGRVNSLRAPNQLAAWKYFYHELGHAHLLNHTDQSGLMSMRNWFSFALSEPEARRWYGIYDASQSSCEAPETDGRSRGDGGRSGGGERGSEPDETHPAVPLELNW